MKIKEGYIEASFLPGITVEEAVNKLMEYRKNGILAYGKFNGVVLYSDTVTMDEAYKEITGRTKLENDEYLKELKERRKKEEEEYERKIPELTLYWRRKGREILTDDKWAFWDEVVPIRLNYLYQGLELGSCLDIVKILNEKGTLAEAKEEIERQNHSGMSFGLVCAMVKEFCERGNEFVNYVNDMQ